MRTIGSIILATAALSFVQAEAGAAPKVSRSAPDAAGKRRSAPLAEVSRANRRALQEPERSRFRDAAQVYEWRESAVYRLFTAPGMVSNVALEPGETLVSVAAGDTARWIIGDTTSGSGVGKRAHILVKPVEAGLRTNLVISTDRRMYLLALESTSGPGMTTVSWAYSGDLWALRGATAAGGAGTREIALDRLNFGYRLSGDRPPWRPVRVFDNGFQTFIEFPGIVSAGEIPPLFALSQSGVPELLNYRQRGRYYVVDRILIRAELRLGGKRQAIVRISRLPERARKGTPR